MSEHSAIGWTDATWNPVTGCSRVSPGCENCYAEALSLRMGWSKKPWTAQNAKENVVLHPDRINQPLSWMTPRMVFVNSMSDLFHDLVPDTFIDEVFAVMAAAKRHTFQVLTKRPERMLEYCLARLLGLPLSNVWLGVSVEDQRRADERIPLLLETPAAVRFISAEPLLDVVRLSQDWRDYLVGWRAEPKHICGGDPEVCDRRCPEAVQVQTEHLDWVIVGGESGRYYRPMDPAWVDALTDECLAASVPIFVKQDSGSQPGKQGQLRSEIWGLKQYPRPSVSS